MSHSTDKIRAILINPWTKEITEVQCHPDDIEDMYRLLSNPLGPRCSCFTTGMNWPNGDTLYVDDEGLLKPGMKFFEIGRRDGQPLAGNGLILGSNAMGESIDAKSMLTEIQTLVRWY